MEVWRPLIMVAGAILGTILSSTSFFLLWKHQEMHFMVRACYVSMMILSILYFELFGVYIICGLQYNPKYFQYLTVAGISCFLSSLSTNKLSVVFFIFQFANHPQMDQTSWKSPRTRFYVISIISQLIFYLAGFFLCRFPAFSYYILPFYYFPITHIINSILKATKVTFRWYYQLFNWAPVVIHAIFIRGYAENFINLTPWKKLQYIVPISMVVMVGPAHADLYLVLAERAGTHVLLPQALDPGPLRVLEADQQAVSRRAERGVSDLLHTDKPEPWRGGRERSRRREPPVTAADADAEVLLLDAVRPQLPQVLSGEVVREETRLPDL
jgi:hypothetical protein